MNQQQGGMLSTPQKGQNTFSVFNNNQNQNQMQGGQNLLQMSTNNQMT